VFRLNPDGTDLREVHSFTNISNELVAPSGVLEASDGKLWGTALRGGANDQGMVFRLNKDGSDYRVVYSFVAPVGSLVAPNPLCEASDGYLYGTTYRGGGSNRGTIFRVHESGDYQFLHAFGAGRGGPVGRLVEGPGGWLYGVTQDTGDFEGGYLFRFRIGPSSAVYALQHFGEGSLYGTTANGGFGSGFGTVFRVDLRPVLAIRTAGAAMELSWPWNGENFNVQVTSNLGSNWLPSGIVWTVNGERVSATVPAPPPTSAQFYRLEKAAVQPGGGQ
jgi:uncharacterized repeat protein (TIGR03803 family)